jgi:UDP:flavonoid glycosyltransferase YjiC (YdhE family)
MTNVVLSSMGYRGDVFNYVPIASELAARGHEVAYVVPREFHPLLDGLGFRCAAPGFDIGPALLDEHAKYVRHLGGARLVRRFFVRLVGPHLDELFEAVDAEVALADVVISHTLASVVSSMACERRGVPMVLGDLFPMHMPSAFTPPVGAPNLGPRGNRLVWGVGRRMAPRAQPGGRAIRAFRRHLGLQADGWSMLDTGAAFTVGLASPSYVDRQADWPTNYRLVGFTPWSGPTEGGLPEEVVAFLDAGPPPIIVTQGTAAASARPEFFANAAEAVERAGGRALILASNEHNATELRSSIPGNRHAVWAFVPLEPLLPRSRGVIHAGGLGTIALTLSAGVPSAISPCFIDSIWHAQRHETLGVGVRIRRRNLPSAVERLVADDDLHGRARQLGRRIAHEDGTRMACDEIETFLKTR